MTGLLGAVEWGGNFDLPPVGELFNYAGIDFLSINRVVVLTLIATAAAAAFFLVAFGSPKIVPGKLQSAAESIVDFIREQIVFQVIGKEGLKFVPLLTTMFVFIWFNNLLEITPFVNFPTTSRMALPAFLAAISWLVFVGIGIRSQGLGYFKEVAIPPGAPWWILPILAPIELISTLILRPFTLAIRLFANMVAGHILLTIVFVAAHAFFFPSWPGILTGIAALILAPIAVGFEFFIATLQAYIFVILTAVYISGALHPEH